MFKIWEFLGHYTQRINLSKLPTFDLIFQLPQSVMESLSLSFTSNIIMIDRLMCPLTFDICNCLDSYIFDAWKFCTGKSV